MTNQVFAPAYGLNNAGLYCDFRQTCVTRCNLRCMKKGPEDSLSIQKITILNQ